MKLKNFIFILLFFSFNSFAAEVVLKPFEIEFEVEKDSYQLDFELKLMCRYEKWVISDSAEYEYKYQTIPLSIQKTVRNDKEIIKLSVNKTYKLKQDEWYRSTKTCGYIQNFYLKSKKYAVGWANQYNRPIKLGFYDHSHMKEYIEYPAEKLKDQINGREVGFHYFNAGGNQISIKLAIDKKPLPGISGSIRTSAYLNPETGMPWALRN